MRRFSIGVRSLLAVLACVLPSILVHAGAFSPPGLYDPETYVLENGLRVVLKPRHHSRSVSFRLAVGLGFWDFPCDKQELPHFIEHLLFAGTSRYGESELDAMVIRHGGYWNATTDSESTIYELEIHSRHALLGLDLLHHILTDAQFSQDQVELSRSIVHRESGGEPSALRQWLYRQGIGKTGFDKYLAVTGYGCAGLPTAGTITRDELLAVKARYYVPEKMALVAVGDFDAGDMRERIADLFGTLPSSSYILPPRSQPACGLASIGSPLTNLRRSCPRASAVP